MAFTPRPLAVPNMRTDYSAENAAFANLGQTLGNLPGDIRKEQLQQQKQQLLGSLTGGNPDYAKVGMGLVALGDTQGGAALIGLGQKQQQLGAQSDITKLFSGAPTSGGSVAPIGTPNEVENGFIGGVQKAGLTNPIGLGAVAAYGKAESGYSPQNVNRTWNDPSQSGQDGTAGGIMSWRADRLQNLQNFARQRGEQGNGSPETQAAFLAQEDPDLIPRLNAAKTPQEANQIMANAWRFAGYDREGGENARRGNLTAQYAQRFGSQGAPAQTAARPVQVAENEADVQRLEAQQGNPVSVSPTPTQVAQADMPAPNAAPVTGPGTTQAAQAQGYAVPGTSLPPNDPFPRVPTQKLYEVWTSPLSSDGQKAMAKSIIDNRQKYTDENAPDKREQQRLTTQKLRNEVEGANFTDLVTPQDRAAAGIDPNYKGPAQRDSKGKLYLPGKPTTEVNIDQKAETAYATANGKAISDRFKGIVEEGDAANQEAGLLSRIRDLGGSIKNMGTGAAIQARLAEAGIKVGENVDEITAYKALIDKLTPTQRIAGAGATSDFDAKMFKSALPSLMNRPGGNELIMNTLDALNTYKRQRGDLVAESMATNEKPAEVIKKLRDLPDPFAAFKDAAKGGMKDLPAGQSAPSPTAQPQQERRVTTIDDARSMPSGTIFVDPNGVRRRVP